MNPFAYLLQSVLPDNDYSKWLSTKAYSEGSPVFPGDGSNRHHMYSHGETANGSQDGYFTVISAAGVIAALTLLPILALSVSKYLAEADDAAADSTPDQDQAHSTQPRPGR